MEKYSSITATAQGLVAYDELGNSKLIRYDKVLKSHAKKRTFNVQKMQQDIEKIHLNMVQRQMYRRLMYGLNDCTSEQIATFSPSTLGKIVDDYNKAKRALHVLKSKKHYSAETDLINALFPDANIGDKDYDWFIDMPKAVTLRTLGISTVDVIEDFIKRRLLPRNFYSLSTQTINLP